MIPVGVLQSVIDEKQEELDNLKYHMNYPEETCSMDRREVFDRIARRADTLRAELLELEEVLAFIESHNEENEDEDFN